MTAQEALDRLVEIIRNDEYHPDYARTVEVAEFAYSTATGDRLDDLITSVRMRESEAQKEQRTRLTKALSPVSVEMIKKYYRKLRKADGVKTSIGWRAGDDNAKRDAMTFALSDFYGGQAVNEYLFDILEDYTFLDPNAFLVIERENIADPVTGAITGVRVYPREITSRQARNFEYRHGVLDWLLVEERAIERNERLQNPVSTFYLYGKGFVLHAIEYVEKKPVVDGYADLAIVLGGGRPDRAKTRTFVTRTYDNGTREVPAIRLGAYLDGQTMTSTAVTPMEPVKPLIEQLINVGSLHDLTVFLHSIPRRRELVEACDYEDGATGYHCDGGYLGDGICPRCKGTGDKSITSEQDMIRIVLPPNFAPADLPDLSKMAHTEAADVELLRWQQEKLDWLLKFIVYATMTRDAVTMAEVARTATELHLNNQDAYDKLQPYAELYSQAYMLVARITTQYLEIADGFTVSHQFPDEYQFETENELIEKFQKAKDAGLSYYVLDNIQRQIIRRQTRSAQEAERVRAWEMWRPFRALPDELVAVVLADRAPEDPQRLLYENFDLVQMEIEQETGGNFYLLAYERQRQVIDDKLTELAGRIRFRSTEPIDFGTFNALP